MEKKLGLLTKVELFRDIGDSELSALLSCLGAVSASYKKEETVFLSGEKPERFGIVLSGQLQIVQDDYYGNRTILGNPGEGSLFGEAFAFAAIDSLPVSVVAASDCELLCFSSNRFAAPCSNACGFHSRLIKNMLGIVAKKNIELTKKIEFTSKRTTREKLLSYLASEGLRAGGGRFRIPFNRQELADYLCVDRSAMSAELSKLRDDGLLRYHKNEFELL